MWRDYHLPASLDEAVNLLSRYDGTARVVAGGTDLFIEMNEGRQRAEALVDITSVSGLDQISLADGWLVVGAAVTHTAIVASDIVQTYARCLAESCGVVGGPQVRNVGTLCGNVAHGLPAADGTVSLLALEGEAQVVGAAGFRWTPLEAFFLGPGRVALDSTHEVLAAVRCRPTGPRQGSAFHRIMRPQGIALPILGMAGTVTLDPSGTRFERVRLAIGPVAPVPFRARGVEARLEGAAVDEAAIHAAAQRVVDECQPRTSRQRATKEYRTLLLPALAKQVLTDATDRAKERLETGN